MNFRSPTRVLAISDAVSCEEMTQVCPRCLARLDGHACPDCSRPRDLPGEAFLKAVGFWLMLFAMSLAVIWLMSLRARDLIWREPILWGFLLLLTFLVLWLGRSLYHLSDGARIVLACLSLLGALFTGLALLIQLEARRTPDSAQEILVYVNGLLWGAVAVQLLRRSSRLVCQPAYRETFGPARPLARFYASPWFWILVLIHGSLIGTVVVSLWKRMG